MFWRLSFFGLCLAGAVAAASTGSGSDSLAILKRQIKPIGIGISVDWPAEGFEQRAADYMVTSYIRCLEGFGRVC